MLKTADENLRELTALSAQAGIPVAVENVGVKVLGNVLLNESTTLGVRISHMHRMMQKRRFAKVSTEYGEITVKIAEGTGRACPEYEQAAALARANNVPYLDVYNAAMTAYERSRGGDDI